MRELNVRNELGFGVGSKSPVVEYAIPDTIFLRAADRFATDGLDNFASSSSRRSVRIASRGNSGNDLLLRKQTYGVSKSRQGGRVWPGETDTSIQQESSRPNHRNPVFDLIAVTIGSDETKNRKTVRNTKSSLIGTDLEKNPASSRSNILTQGLGSWLVRQC